MQRFSLYETAGRHVLTSLADGRRAVSLVVSSQLHRRVWTRVAAASSFSSCKIWRVETQEKDAPSLVTYIHVVRTSADFSFGPYAPLFFDALLLSPLFPEIVSRSVRGVIEYATVRRPFSMS